MSAGSIRRRVMLGIVASGYGKLVTAAVQLLLVPVMTLHWGLPLYGQWLLLSSVPIFLNASDFGFSTAAGMRIIAESARGEDAEALLTFRAARTMIVRLTLAAFAVLGCAAALLPGRVLAVTDGMPVAEARMVLALLGGYALLSLQTALFLAVARAVQRTAQATAIDATTQLCEGLAICLVVLAGGEPIHAAVTHVVVRGAGLVGTMAYARAVTPWLGRPGQGASTRDRTRALWRPALAAMVLPLSQAGYLQGCAVAVGAAAGAAAVPVYTSLRTLSRIGLQLLAVLYLPLMPEYTAAHARGATSRAAVIAGGLLTASALTGLVYALVIGVLGIPLIGLWTDGVIRPPQAMVTLTAVGALMSVLWNPLAALLLAISRHETYAYVSVVLAAVVVALCYVLVTWFGLSGAAAAGLVMEAGMLATVIAALRREGAPIGLGHRSLAAAIPPRWRRSGTSAE